MSTSSEPNPSARRAEDFPRTTTLPAAWHLEDETPARGPSAENEPMPERAAAAAAAAVPATGNCPAAEPENLFSRRLEPFPGVHGMMGMML